MTLELTPLAQFDADRQAAHPPLLGRLRCEILTRFDQLEPLAEAWHGLWLAGPRPEIFTTFAWARASWRSSGGRRSLATAVVYDGEDPVGILPLACQGRNLEFLGRPHSDYNDMIADVNAGAEVLEVALRSLLARAMPWRRCLLEEVPFESNLRRMAPLLSSFLRSRLVVAAASTCPTLILGETRTQVLKALLGKQSPRRHQKKLGKLGTLRFRHLNDRAEIKRHLPEFFRQHQARRAMAGDQSFFREEEPRVFYEALVDELEPAGALRFAVLELDQKPIAYHLGFELEGKFIWYKPTFNVNYWDYGPGEVLLVNLFEYLQSRPVDEFDFTIGEEAFKQRFANLVRQNVSAEFYPYPFQTLPSRISLAAKTRLRQRPRVFTAAKNFHDFLSSRIHRARLSVQQYGVIGATLTGIRKALRELLWSRDEVFVYTLDRGNQRARRHVSSEPGSGENLVIESGSLADLANLASIFPNFFCAERLHDARERLKRGDGLFIARQENKVVATAWLGILERIKTSWSGAPGLEIALKGAAPLIYDCWMIPAERFSLISMSLFEHLAQLAFREHDRVWASFPGTCLQMKRDLDAAGWSFRHRLVRVRACHWMKKAWIE